MRFVRMLVGSIVAAGACLVAAPAFADPATANKLQLGLGFRYGVDMKSGDDLNPWGIGLGLEAGYTLPNAVYLGGNIEYFFGEQIGDDTNGVSGNIWQLSAEGGYDIGIGPIFVLRPKLGLGLANVHEKTCIQVATAGGPVGGCSSDTQSDFALFPGATFIVMPPGFNLTADVRYELVFADKTGQGLLFTVGIGF